MILQIVTKNGRTALWYAASEGHNNVLYYLLREKHDSYSLLEDRRVSFICVQFSTIPGTQVNQLDIISH